MSLFQQPRNAYRLPLVRERAVRAWGALAVSLFDRSFIDDRTPSDSLFVHGALGCLQFVRLG